MNFSKKKATRKRKALSDASPMVGKKAGVSTLRILFVLFITVCIVGLCGTYGVVKGIIDNAPDIKDVNIAPSGYATFIYDANGNQMQKLTAPTSNRMSVSLSDIPIDLQHAVVAVEDERFYDHNGIDIRGIARAFVVGAKNGFRFSEGASTITQQLLKNNVFTTWTTETTLVERFRRKFQEQYLALELEKELTAQGSDCKNIILENYLNTINLGAGSYGVQAAAQRYFAKDVKDLTLSECTVLAGITQNPSAYNPIRHPEQNAKRRKKVLKHMVDQGYITKEQQQEVLADNVYERIATAEESTGITKVYSYFIDELTSQIVDDFVNQLGYQRDQAYQQLYNSGLQIFTTQDTAIQDICDEEYENPENFPEKIDYSIDWALTLNKADGTQVNYSKEMLGTYFTELDSDFDLLFDSEEEAQSYVDQYKQHVIETGDEIAAERISFSPEPQSSIVIMDQSTGYVKAIVGGRGKKEASLTLNRASGTLRQPGSTFKILSAYAPAIEEGLIGLGTTIKDEPYEYEGGRPVKNWLRNTYQGDITVREAINESVNVVAVKTITEATPQKAFEMLKNFGITSLVENKKIKRADGSYGIYSDIRQPLALGGITYGVSNLELTAAYASIANGGEYTKPIFYTKILDKDGNILIDNTPESTRVIKDSTAYLLTSAMESVITDPKGTGRNLSLGKMPVAGKTGSTSSYNDVWFSGFTPYYTCTVWAGYDNNEKLPKLDNYRSYHQTLWKKIMSRVHEGLPSADFAVPASVEKASICTRTGKLASGSCPSIQEYYASDSLPEERCKGHYVSAPTPAKEKKENTSPPNTKTPGTTNPETNNPGTSDPGTNNPGTNNPGTSDPGTNNPGTSNPGTSAPDVSTPDTNTPETNPGTNTPGNSTPDTNVPNNPPPPTGESTPDTP